MGKVRGFPYGSAGKESACNARDTGDKGLIPGSGRSPGGRNGTPLQYSCVENPYGQRRLGMLQSKGRKASNVTQ